MKLASSGLLVALWLALTFPAPAGHAAPPLPPEELTYQGLLLDGTGAPRLGVVDLTLRVYDALVGGTLVYKQEFASVLLIDGVFTVVLGPSGSGSDSPVDPLTTSLRDALVADVGATGAGRFLEVTVGTEGALTRTQIFSVPWAFHAGTADEAAFADTAGTASTAQDTASVGGLDASFVTQLYEHANFDGQAPLNSDPDEGLGDTDLDGVANFIDPDNDDDGLLDGAEVAAGSSINLVTPTITSVEPATGDADLTQGVTVTGTNFEAGMSVAFGSETPAPTNLTATRFDVAVGPQTPALVDVTVTRLNAESATATSAYEFVKIEPTITGFDPPAGSTLVPTPITLAGTNFQPDMTIAFGSETPTPGNVTPTSADVVVGPQSGTVPVTVTLANGNSDSAPYDFNVPGILLTHDVSPGGQLSLGVKGTQQTILGMQFEYGVDGDADLVPETVLAFPTNGGAGQLAVAWSPGGDAAGLRCRTGGSSSECTVEVAVDSDADFELADETGTVVETISGPGARIESPSIAFDPSGRVALGYRVVAVGDVRVVAAHDRDGDGSFTGTNEHVTIETLGGPADAMGELAVDASGRLAHAYRGAPAQLRLAYDRSGDGDFDDLVGGQPELFTLASALGSDFSCVGATFDGGGSLAVVYGGAMDDLVLAVDADQDGDFEAGERTTLATAPVGACDVIGGAGLGLAVAHDGGGLLNLLVDRDGNGDFAGTDESLSIPPFAPPGSIEMRRNAAGGVVLATEFGVFRDTLP